jgi:hypothetical protein
MLGEREHACVRAGGAGRHTKQDLGVGKTSRACGIGDLVSRVLAIDAERQNWESTCAILGKRVAILLETCIPRKSSNLAIICHLTRLLEVALACTSL